MKNKRIICAILLFCLMVVMFSPFTVSAEETYTLSGEWVIDKEFAFPDTPIRQDIKFTTKFSTDTYRYIVFEKPNLVIGNYSGITSAYSSLGWTSSAFRFLDFGLTPQSVSKEFYLYFTSIAKQRSLKPSDILDDLSKDSRFDLEEYPDDPTDYGLHVVQIAESENHELFIYVYQPSNATRDYEARYINMSLENPTSKKATNKLYSLTLVDTHGTLDKYKVNNFFVSDDEDRYYNIATIYRFFDSEVDNSSDAVDTIQGRGYEVGQCWHAYYYNDELYYERKDVNVVEVDIKATGSIYYPEGFKLHVDACDSHYVAFSVENYKVDQIFDADITYTMDYYTWTESYTIGGSRTDTLESSTLVESDYLSSKETGSNDGDGWFGVKYTWTRIQDIDTFLSDVAKDTDRTFSEEELNALKNSQFVFRFLETENYKWTDHINGNASGGHYTLVEDISILRLHFVSEGKRYNLGVVGDLVGIDSTPDGGLNVNENLENWWEENGDEVTAIVALIIFLLAAILIYIYARDLGVAIIRGVADLLTLLINLLLLPFKLLSALLKNRDG